MKWVVLPVLILLLAVSGLPNAARGETPVVVELYTSQGCSSCPPADDILAGLAGRNDVIPLALHVDYWDYIGWKDAFARPDHTTRQKAYARQGGRDMIYTPQMIINGRDHVVGARADDLSRLIRAQKREEPRARLAVTRLGHRLTIDVTPENGGPARPATLALVRFKPDETVRVRRGENAGHTLTYTHIVTDWQKIGDWDGTAPARLTTDLTGSLPAVVLVQEAGPGRIVAAIRIE